MRRSRSCSIEIALGLALIACGPRSADPATPGAPSAEPAPRISELSLRLDHVRRLREMRAAMRQGDVRHLEADRQLADALIGLAKYHRQAAIEADPKAASLPPPRDLHPYVEEPERTGDEAEIDYGEQAPDPPELPREDATFAGLTPAARAQVRAADQCVREAIEILDTTTWMAGGKAPRDSRKHSAQLAELFEEIGQRTVARKAWYFVVREDIKDSLTAKAYLAFADWLVTRKKTQKEAISAFAKGAEAASVAKDTALLRRICDRARAAAVEAPPSCVSPSLTP